MLSQIDPEDVKLGIELMLEDERFANFPPSMQQFYHLCKVGESTGAPEHVIYKLPKLSMTPQERNEIGKRRAAEALEKLKRGEL